MPKFAEKFERNQVTMDFMDLGYRLMEGVDRMPTPLIRALRHQTSRDTKNILLAGSPSSFNPEFAARLYRRLVNLTLGEGVNQETSQMLESSRDANVKVYTVDRDDETLQTCRDSMAERGSFLKEQAGIEFAYQKMDLTDLSDEAIAPGSIDVAFMDCLLSLNPENWVKVLAKLANLIGPSGIVFFREMLIKSPWLKKNTPDSVGMVCEGLNTNYHCLYEHALERGVVENNLDLQYLPISRALSFRHFGDDVGAFGVSVRERVGVITKQANVTMG